MNRAVFAMRDLRRLLGLMTVGVGIAWALQLLNFGWIWLVGDATLVGAGAGLIGAVAALRSTEQPALQSMAVRSPS